MLVTTTSVSMAEGRVHARLVQEIVVVDSRTDGVIGNADIYDSSIDDVYLRNAGKVSAAPGRARALR